jgi:hypothetical protein
MKNKEEVANLIVDKLGEHDVSEWECELILAIGQLDDLPGLIFQILEDAGFEIVKVED